MTDIPTLVSRVRLELADTAQAFSETDTGDGVTTIFQLNHYPLDASALTVTVNNVLQLGTTFSVDERTGRIVFATAPALNATVVFAGTNYRYFCTADLSTIVQTAFNEHIYGRQDAFGRALTLDLLPPIEEYPVALLATVQALYALATDSAFDIDITAPDGVTIPRSERYRQLMDAVAQRRAQYEELCRLLNIGLYRIEMFTLRRISRTTNKYVPIYRPQEIDDYSQPQRVFLPMPTYGGAVIPTTAANYDLVFTQGDAYSVTLDFGFDLTGYTVAAQIRPFPGSPLLLAQMTVTVIDAVMGQVTLSLTPDLTYLLPLMSNWDCQVTASNNPSDTRTMVSGGVFVQRQVTQ